MKRFKNITNLTDQSASISREARDRQVVPQMETQYPQEVPYRQQVLFGQGSFNQMGDRFDNTITQNERIKQLEQDVADAKERLLHQPLQPTEMNPPMGDPINIPSLSKKPKTQKKYTRRFRGVVVRLNGTNLSEAVSRPEPDPNLSEAVSRPSSPPSLNEVLEGGGASALSPFPPSTRYREDGITEIRPYKRKPKTPTKISVLEGLKFNLNEGLEGGGEESLPEKIIEKIMKPPRRRPIQPTTSSVLANLGS